MNYMHNFKENNKVIREVKKISKQCQTTSGANFPEFPWSDTASKVVWYGL